MDIVVAEHRCTPNEAFKILVTLSQDTNVKLADVAAGLAYEAQGPAGDSANTGSLSDAKTA